MDNGFKRVGDLVAGEVKLVDQAFFDEQCGRFIEDLIAGHAPEAEIARERARWKGGACPTCGKQFVQIEVRNGFGEFVMYEPTCECAGVADESVKAQEQAQKDLRLTTAGIPERYRQATFSTWDYSVGDALNGAMKKCLAYAKGDDWVSGRGLILYGNVGAGKTRCAVSTLVEIIGGPRRVAVQYLPMTKLLDQVIRSKDDRGFIAGIAENQVVVVDDMDKMAAESEWSRSQVFELFDALYRGSRALIGTTNASGVEQMVERFGYAVVSRWQETCTMVAFGGGAMSDYRLRGGGAK